MRITAPVTDYIRESVLTTEGDLAVRGAALVERLARGVSGQVLRIYAASPYLRWVDLFNELATTGDLWIRDGATYTHFSSGAAGTYLQGKGAGVLPAYEQTMPPLTSKGDLILQGTALPERLGAGAIGNVLHAQGAGNKPYWKSLFDTLTTTGDLWMQSAGNPIRVAAGALDTYFKGQGAATLPIYEKMALRDTGVEIGSLERSSSGSQAITGVGFLPSIVLFFAVDGTAANLNWSMGFDNVTAAMCINSRSDGTTLYRTTTRSIFMYRDGSNFIDGLLASLDSDGFTITWAATGTCVANVIYLCLP